jgi:hypothetical protein
VPAVADHSCGAVVVVGVSCVGLHCVDLLSSIVC